MKTPARPNLFGNLPSISKVAMAVPQHLRNQLEMKASSIQQHTTTICRVATFKVQLPSTLSRFSLMVDVTKKEWPSLCLLSYMMTYAMVRTSARREAQSISPPTFNSCHWPGKGYSRNLLLSHDPRQCLRKGQAVLCHVIPHLFDLHYRTATLPLPAIPILSAQSRVGLAHSSWIHDSQHLITYSMMTLTTATFTTKPSVTESSIASEAQGLQTSFLGKT